MLNAAPHHNDQHTSANLITSVRPVLNVRTRISPDEKLPALKHSSKTEGWKSQDFRRCKELANQSPSCQKKLLSEVQRNSECMLP